MSWQRCPVCDGTGQVPHPMSVSGTQECPTCRGKRIINEVSGRPPEEPSTTSVGADQKIPEGLDEQQCAPCYSDGSPVEKLPSIGSTLLKMRCGWFNPD